MDVRENIRSESFYYCEPKIGNNLLNQSSNWNLCEAKKIINNELIDFNSAKNVFNQKFQNTKSFFQAPKTKRRSLGEIESSSNEDFETRYRSMYDLSNKFTFSKFMSFYRKSCTLNSNTTGEIFHSKDLEFKEVLGEGFFGRVTKVVKKATREVMVMKELKVFDDKSEKQFIAELEFLKMLNHKNLLKYIGIIFKNKRISIILEYISGGTLKKLIKNHDNIITSSNKAKIAYDIASGMAFLHSRNIAHRDLTSRNCLVKNKENFNIVISDFGLSTILHKGTISSRYNKNDNHDQVGDPFWMAPEMINGFCYDINVDVFSYGMIICELLGRCSTSPVNIPRLKNFGLDHLGFMKKIENMENPQFLKDLAVSCCDFIPSNRPCFKTIILKLLYKSKFQVMINCTTHSKPITHSKIEFQNFPKSSEI